MRTRFSYLLVGLFMLASAAAAAMLKPSQRLAAEGPPVKLADLIPESFQGWHADPRQGNLMVNPRTAEKLEKLYNQTLSRIYVNGRGESIMLSIAYGGNQADQSLQVHRPEFCYAAQGFRITHDMSGQLHTHWGVLPVRRLVAVRGARREPITYWITVGNDATLPGIGRKLLQLKYGLTGRIPDGMLVRVSSVDRDAPHAYRIQEAFLDSLLSTIAARPPALARRDLSRLGLL